jgi:hypothetical protein
MRRDRRSGHSPEPLRSETVNAVSVAQGKRVGNYAGCSVCRLTGCPVRASCDQGALMAASSADSNALRFV